MLPNVVARIDDNNYGGGDNPLDCSEQHALGSISVQRFVRVFYAAHGIMPSAYAASLPPFLTFALVHDRNHTAARLYKRSRFRPHAASCVCNPPKVNTSVLNQRARWHELIENDKLLHSSQRRHRRSIEVATKTMRIDYWLGERVRAGRSCNETVPVRPLCEAESTDAILWSGIWPWYRCVCQRCFYGLHCERGGTAPITDRVSSTYCVDPNADNSYETFKSLR